MGTIIRAAVWCVAGSFDDEDNIKLVIDVSLLSSDEAGGVKDEGIAIKPRTSFFTLFREKLCLSLWELLIATTSSRMVVSASVAVSWADSRVLFVPCCVLIANDLMPLNVHSKQTR